MKKAKLYDKIMDHTFGRHLSKKIQSLPIDECLPLETIAQLVEGRITGKQRDQIMSHISVCSNCYEVFRLSDQLRSESQPGSKKGDRIRLFRPLALAASIAVLVISLIIVYQTGQFQKSPALLSEKIDETTDTSKDSEHRFREKELVSPEKSGKNDRPKKALKKGPARKTGDAKLNIQVLGDNRPEKKETPPPQSRTLKTAQPATINPVEREAFQATESEGQKRIEEKPSAKQKSDSTVASGRQDSLKRSKTDKKAGLSQIINRHANGNVQTLHQYQRTKGKNVLEQILEYNPAGRNTLIQNMITGSLTRMDYHPNGHLKFRQEFLQGQPHGIWIKWDDQGRILEKQIYDKGKLIKTLH